MKLEDTYSDYIYNFVDTICKKFGPRYSCSKAEKEANQWIKTELDKFCDETFIDEFETHPGLYPQGLIKVAGVLGGISLIFMPLIFPFPIISLIFIMLGLIVVYSELVLMKEWIKFMFKKGTSSNVFGIIKPSGKVKFRVIFEGHSDSAKQMKIASYEKKPPRYKIILGVYYLFHTIIFSIVKFTAQIIYGPSIVLAEWGIFSFTIIDLFYFLPLIVIYPLFIWVIRGFLGKTVVLGANDNLAASGVSAAIGKYLSINRPRNIEVWVGSQGSEEVGDKGAKAFVEKYGKKGVLDNSYTVVLEECGGGGEIMILEKDMHKATYTKEINEKLIKAHEEVKKDRPNILPIKTGRLLIGSCDACRYIRKGYKAAAIMGVEKGTKKAPHWHSPEDTPENIKKSVLRDFLELSLKFVEMVDRELD
ncbi:MAG: M28 family peptidase [Promethearchaeota archaeon]|nr:MAG: M28 family peptidase [Candidatus Lokiarchaeota archaeon]